MATAAPEATERDRGRRPGAARSVATVVRIAVVSLTGAILGFAGVFFGYNGALVATVVAGVLAAYYMRLGRHADVGWLLSAGGAVVLFLLGRAVVDSLVDPAVSIQLPTYLGAAVGVLLLGTGAMILGLAYAARRRG